MQFLDSYAAHLETRMGHDRHFCPTWKSSVIAYRLVHPFPVGHDESHLKSSAVSRVVEEYTVRDKVTSIGFLNGMPS